MIEGPSRAAGWTAFVGATAAALTFVAGGCGAREADRVRESGEGLVGALIRGEERAACELLTERAARSLGEEADTLAPADSTEASCSAFVETVAGQLSRRDRAEISQVVRAEEIEVDATSATGMLDFGDEERTFEAVLEDGDWLVDEFEPAGLLADRIEELRARVERETQEGEAEEASEPRLVGQLELNPVMGGATSPKPRGLALIAEQGDGRQLIVQATVAPVGDDMAYEVWLYNSRSDAVSLGAQRPDDTGAFRGAGALPRDFEGYDFIDVSREPLRGDAAHSGDSVLRARLNAVAPAP